MDNTERPSVENLLIFQKAYDYVKWVIPTVERFPFSIYLRDRKVSGQGGWIFVACGCV